MSVFGEQGGKYELLLKGCELEKKKKGGSECCVRREFHVVNGEMLSRSVLEYSVIKTGVTLWWMGVIVARKRGVM